MGVHRREPVFLRRFVLYLVLGGWVTLAAVQAVADPERGAWNWIHGIAYLGVTLALVGLLIAHAVDYVRERARAKPSGGAFFTARFVKRFLIVGWLLAVLWRFATFGDAPLVISVGPFWLFGAGLLVYLVRWLVRRPRNGSGGADISRTTT